MTQRWTRLYGLVATLGSFALLAGCASSPDIPEDSEQTEYQSSRGSESDSSASGGGSQEGSMPTTGQARMGGEQTRGGKKGLPQATGPIAHVDGEPIPADRFNREMKKVARSKQFPPKLVRKFQSRLVDKLIDRTLIERAVADSSVEVSDQAIDKKLEQVRSRVKKRAKAAGKDVEGKSLEQLTQKLGISGDDLRNSIRQSIAIEKLLVQKGLELPTDEDIRNYYEDNQSKFEQPEQVRARHILVRVKPDAEQKVWDQAEKRIKEIHNKASGDKDFAKLARNHSDGPRASKGGDLGFASRAQLKKMDPKFAETAFSLDSDKLSDPVKTRYGWHIVKKVEHREAESVPYEKVESKIRDQLKNKKVKKKLETYVKELRSKASVEKHPENIE